MELMERKKSDKSVPSAGGSKNIKTGGINMKKALVVWGGWDGHEPQKGVSIFKPFLESAGFTVEVSDNLDVYLDREKLKTLDLIVPIWTMGVITEAQEQGLLEAVKSGVGLAGWHGCMADS